DIPTALGVPAIPRSPQAIVSTAAALLLTDSSPPDPLSTDWQIVDASGNPALSPDGVVAFEYIAEDRVATHPIEQGSFAAYNKVAMPYIIRMVMVCGGHRQPRELFLSALEQLRSGTDLVSVATPDASYSNANLVRFDYRREARSGVTLLAVDCEFHEIRTSTAAVSPPTLIPAASSSIKVGAVIPGPLSVAQTAAVNAVASARAVAKGLTLTSITAAL
ncbi:MAG: hypothetical protein KGH75_06505, partial [Rhodospirillales bacterium]|nr:hypothetical protein [Rhodospirillales bacterium]